MTKLYNFVEEKIKRQGSQELCTNIWINFFESLAFEPVKKYEIIIKDFISSLDLGHYPIQRMLKTAVDDQLLGFCVQYVASQLSLASQFSILKHMEDLWPQEKDVIYQIFSFMKYNQYNDSFRRSRFKNSNESESINLNYNSSFLNP